MMNLNRLLNGAVAGVVVGLLAGAGARLSMRVVALIGGMSTDFSIGGTLGILFLFSILGIVYGTLFVGLHSLVRMRMWAWGGLYGLFFAGLTTIPFLRNPGGELALAAPWVGAALFAPIPLFAALLLAVLNPRLDRRTAHQAPRTVHGGWLAALTIAAGMALISMGPMMDATTRVPRVVWDLYDALGLSFAQARDLNGFLGVPVTVGSVTLLIALFMAAGQASGGRLASLGLLLFAAGFFNAHGLFSGMMESLRLAALASGLVKAAGASAFVLLLHTFPTGGFHLPWGRGLVLSVGAGAVIWFMLPVTGIHSHMLLPEVVRLPVVALILGSGLYALVVRLRSGTRTMRRQIAGPVVGLAVPVLWFLGLWMASLVAPELRLTGAAAPFAPLSVALFLLPWLLPPATLLHAVLRRGLWQAPSPQPSGPAAGTLEPTTESLFQAV